MLPNPQPFFADLPDPRRETRNKLHKLEDIVMLTLCVVLCGYEDWVSIEDYGHENEAWLRQFLALPNGIGGKTNVECRYFISSCAIKAQDIARLVRAH